jgi:ankyrin repeat protein
LASHRAGHLDVAKALLDVRKYTKVDINAKDTYGWTPLHYAVSQKRTEMVEYLIRRGASVNARTDRKTQGIAAQSSPGDMVGDFEWVV